jgi:hypothetical protein
VVRALFYIAGDSRVYDFIVAPDVAARLVSETPAMTSKPPITIEIKIGSFKISVLSAIPNTGTKLLNTAVRAGPIAFTPS